MTRQTPFCDVSVLLVRCHFPFSSHGCRCWTGLFEFFVRNQYVSVDVFLSILVCFFLPASPTVSGMGIIDPLFIKMFFGCFPLFSLNFCWFCVCLFSNIFRCCLVHCGCIRFGPLSCILHVKIFIVCALIVRTLLLFKPKQFCR